MFNTFRDLVNFYSQKFNVTIHPIWSTHLADPKSQPGLVIAYPTDGEEKTIGDSKFRYNPEFGKDFEGTLFSVESFPMIKIGENFLLLLFRPEDKSAEKLMKQLIDKYLPKLAVKYKKNQRQQFMNQLVTCAQSRKGALECQVSSDEYELENLIQKVTELSTKISNTRHMMKFFEKSDDYLKKFAIQMWVDMQKLVPGLYQGFRFEGDSIIGKTQFINIKYDDQWYDFNPYEVEINLQNSSVRIYGDTNEVDGYIHPHVSDYIPCWGSIGGLIAKLIGQVDLHGLFQLVHNFLTSYNPDDPYLRIEKWDPDWVDEDECSDYCVYCEEYGHDASHCAFCHYCDVCSEFHCNEEPCQNREEAEVEAQTA